MNLFFSRCICLQQQLCIFEFRHRAAVTVEQKSECSSRYIFGSNQNSSITSKFRIEARAAFKDILSAFFVNPQVPVYYWRQNSKRKMRGQKGVPLWRQKHMLDQKREREKKSCFGKHFQHPYVLYGLGKKRYFFVCLKYSLFLLKFIYSLGSANSKDFFLLFF